MASNPQSDSGLAMLEEIVDGTSRIELLSSSDDDGQDSDGIEGMAFPGKPLRQSNRRSKKKLPLWLQRPALVSDPLVTTTSEAQNKTTDECRAHLIGEDNQGLPLNVYGMPLLRREAHAGFLRNAFNPLPEPYEALDASRPWIFYWNIAGLSFLDEDLSSLGQRLVTTVRPLQNPSGGFGGGHGQLSHCAGSYAAVLALATVDCLHAVNRKTMWRWLGQMKQADGGFTMAEGAEEDIRGAYCAMTMLTLLNLPLELPPDAPARKAGLASFTDRLGDWISKCQTYEGGIAGAPGNEAHGAYAFCALACLCILDDPQTSIPKYLDITSLIHWLASRQTPAEGGFAGRTEKLVDACYSHWAGGCWSLLEAAVGLPEQHVPIWNRAALIRYLLTCCQQPGKKGGMRDKPSTRPDGYHSCYSLAGLSAAMNTYAYAAPARSNSSSGRLEAAFGWTARGPTQAESKEWLVDRRDVVEPVHPVFVLRMEVVEKARKDWENIGL